MVFSVQVLTERVCECELDACELQTLRLLPPKSVLWLMLLAGFASEKDDRGGRRPRR